MAENNPVVGHAHLRPDSYHRIDNYTAIVNGTKMEILFGGTEELGSRGMFKVGGRAPTRGGRDYSKDDTK